MNGHHTHLFALTHQVVDGFAGSFGCRTHQDDHALGIFSSVVVEQMIFATGDFRNLLHVVFNHFGHLVVGSVASLAVCEECFGVFGRTAGHRALRRQGAVAEALDVGRVNELGNFFLRHHFNLVILM